MHLRSVSVSSVIWDFSQWWDVTGVCMQIQYPLGNLYPFRWVYCITYNVSHVGESASIKELYLFQYLCRWVLNPGFIHAQPWTQGTECGVPLFRTRLGLKVISCSSKITAVSQRSTWVITNPCISSVRKGWRSFRKRMLYEETSAFPCHALLQTQRLLPKSCCL